ncbi:hypothetical protein NDU88_005386 [Pleurodeles waltl]|uniref:Uncharacterized protein n=1 Tax=Pleurodeles waltl TaxID=8319 RepID=A0AAV7MBY6_PLEWA|nr:hypothetical protein NDU88_005386 [Pleurodeles waltl]
MARLLCPRRPFCEERTARRPQVPLGLAVGRASLLEYSKAGDDQEGVQKDRVCSALDVLHLREKRIKSEPQALGRREANKPRAHGDLLLCSPELLLAICTGHSGSRNDLSSSGPVLQRCGLLALFTLIPSRGERGARWGSNAPPIRALQDLDSALSSIHSSALAASHHPRLQRARLFLSQALSP